MTYNYAALPPQVQEKKDLAIMQAFIDKHKNVSSTLRHIDIKSHKVYYAEGCVAIFKRASVVHPPRWVGPASPLIFKKATCPID